MDDEETGLPVTLVDELKELYVHLRDSGTGEAKLIIVATSKTVHEVLDRLKEKYQGTYEKVQKWLTKQAKTAAKAQAEAKPAEASKTDEAAAKKKS